VPEATIHKHGDATPSEDDVGATTKTWDDEGVHSVPRTPLMKDAADSELGRSVTASVALHDRASMFTRRPRFHPASVDGGPSDDGVTQVRGRERSTHPDEVSTNPSSCGHAVRHGPGQPSLEARFRRCVPRLTVDVRGASGCT
jgi:hypothetical protein